MHDAWTMSRSAARRAREAERTNKFTVRQHYPADTMWIDADKAFEEELMQVRTRVVARAVKTGDRPDLCAETPPLEGLKAGHTVAANQ